MALKKVGKKAAEPKGFEAAKKLKRMTIKEYGAYDQERAFLTELLDSGDYIEALTARVADVWFAGDDNRRYFTWVDAQFAKNGKIPSVDRFQEEFPDFKGLDTNDSMKELVGALREKRLYQEMSMLIKKTGEGMRDDAQTAVSSLSEAVAGILGRLSESTDTPIAMTRHRIKDAYTEAKINGGMAGVKWPWDALNTATRGARPGQYIGFYGDAGTMKTFLAVYMAHHFETEGFDTLFVSMEMSEEEIESRFAAQMASVDYDAFEAGALSPNDEKRFYKCIDELANSKFRVFTPVSRGQAALAEIDAKIQQHKPRFVFIDGLGMLPSDSEWGGFSEINKGLKNISKRRKVTTIATHHTNRDTPKDKTSHNSSDVALGDTLVRYCDMLFRIVREEQHREDREILVSAVKIRNGKMPCAFTIHAKPSYCFEQKSTVKAAAKVDRETDSADKDDDDEDILVVSGAKTIERWLTQMGSRGLRSTGMNHLKGTCPRCLDDGLDFSINTENGMYICYRESCGTRGHIRGLLIDILGYSRQAAEKAVEGIVLWEAVSEEVFTLPDYKDRKRKQVAVKDPEDEARVGLYRFTPTYMVKRGFTKEVLRRYEIGYDMDKKRVVFPVRDVRGTLLGFSTRATLPWDMPKYLHLDFRKSQVLYGLHLATDLQRPLLVGEGNCDALALHQLFEGQAVSPLGCQVSDAQVKMMFPYRKVILGFDWDDEGRAATERVGSALLGMGHREVFVMQEVEGLKDPGELLLEQHKHRGTPGIVRYGQKTSTRRVWGSAKKDRTNAL